jgi:hypothetical protein
MRNQGLKEPDGCLLGVTLCALKSDKIAGNVANCPCFEKTLGDPLKFLYNGAP